MGDISVTLSTIRDISLILRTFDPGGCTSACPLDEYDIEAARVYLHVVEMVRNDPWFKDVGDELSSILRARLLSHKIERTIQRSFAGIASSDIDMYLQIARACLNVWKENVRINSERTTR